MVQSVAECGEAVGAARGVGVRARRGERLSVPPERERVAERGQSQRHARGGGAARWLGSGRVAVGVGVGARRGAELGERVVCESRARPTTPCRPPRPAAARSSA